jgi:peptidoglycan-N-acetylglucosamine deacetylase
MGKAFRVVHEAAVEIHKIVDFAEVNDSSRGRHALLLWREASSGFAEATQLEPGSGFDGYLDRFSERRAKHMMPRKMARYSLRVIRGLFSIATRDVIGTISHVHTRESVAALTFDDGPDPEYTPQLLTILERYGAQATFFMIGKAAQAHPELVRRVAQAGHAIGNHSWDHPSFPLISGRERRAQIRGCARALAPYGSWLFRPPYGEQNIASRIDALLLGYKVVMFDSWSDDWCGGDPDTIARQLERRMHPGSVIALHDGLSDALDESYFNREPMLKAIEIFLDRLGGRVRFVTIPELLRHGRASKRLWYRESNVELLNKLVVRGGPGRRYSPNGRSESVDALLGIFVEVQSKKGRL